MVNLVTTYCRLLKGIMKMAGVRPYTVEIEPGTVMRFLVPSETILKPKNHDEQPKLVSKPTKPVVVLLQGFCADGIMTWQFQVSSLTKKYAVYVPDLIFFGSSITDKPDRSLTFQAQCLATALGKLGVDKCILVGFSYGGMVALKMGELLPKLVQAIVITGAIMATSESIIENTTQEIGFSSSSELLLPLSVNGLKVLLSLGAYKKLWLPNRIYKDFFKVMFTNRKERSELLEALVNSYKDIKIPNYPQRIHLLWGEDDQIFKQELALIMKEKLGNKATFEGIKKAGHLAHMDRPCVYNRCLKQFLHSVLQGRSKLF